LGSTKLSFLRLFDNKDNSFPILFVYLRKKTLKKLFVSLLAVGVISIGCLRTKHKKFFKCAMRESMKIKYKNIQCMKKSVIENGQCIGVGTL